MSGTTPESGDSQELSRSDKFPTLQLSVLGILLLLSTSRKGIGLLEALADVISWRF